MKRKGFLGSLIATIFLAGPALAQMPGYGQPYPQYQRPMPYGYGQYPAQMRYGYPPNGYPMPQYQQYPQYQQGYRYPQPAARQQSYQPPVIGQKLPTNAKEEGKLDYDAVIQEVPATVANPRQSVQISAKPDPKIEQTKLKGTGAASLFGGLFKKHGPKQPEKLYVPSEELILDEPGCETGACPPAAVCPPEAPCVEECPVEIRKPAPLPSTPPGYCWYGSAEYLYLWFREASAPPLVNFGGATAVGGNLNQLIDENRQGARFTIGKWLDPSNLVSVEGTFLWIPERDGSIAFTSPGTVALAHPFNNSNTGAASVFNIAGPGLGAGSTRLSELTRFWSAEINLRKEMYRCEFFHADCLAGGRYVNYDDGLDINSEWSTVAAPGVTRTFQDSFDARNQIYGGQLGGYFSAHKGIFFADFWGKLLIGNNHQTVKITGTSGTAGPGGSAVVPGGLYAQPTNIGDRSRDRFVFMPEVGVNAGIQLTERLRIKGGYNFMYITSVVRPGDQIDANLNPSQFNGGVLVGTANPAFNFRDTDFWAHGFSGTIEFRY